MLFRSRPLYLVKIVVSPPKTMGFARQYAHFCIAKLWVLQPNMPHFARQYAGFCTAKISHLKHKTRNTLICKALLKTLIFCIFRAEAPKISEQSPFSGVRKNQCVSRNGHLATMWLQAKFFNLSIFQSFQFPTVKFFFSSWKSNREYFPNHDAKVRNIFSPLVG